MHNAAKLLEKMIIIHEMIWHIANNNIVYFRPTRLISKVTKKHPRILPRLAEDVIQAPSSTVIKIFDSLLLKYGIDGEDQPIIEPLPATEKQPEKNEKLI